jgi:hypothetical protein
LGTAFDGEYPPHPPNVNQIRPSAETTRSLRALAALGEHVGKHPAKGVMATFEGSLKGFAAETLAPILVTVLLNSLVLKMSPLEVKATSRGALLAFSGESEDRRKFCL